MDLTRKRHIASWILLAVFVPMMILASIHTHEDVQTEVVVHCDHVHCHGHLTVAHFSIDDCVLCQFLGLPFTVCAIAAVVFINKVFKFLYAQPVCALHMVACGIPSLRAPPVFLNNNR